ncbi:DNA-binding protein [Streptomyces sp. CJ_13]|uniref:LuxR C-terminal-related transcriptional regulator n=1 Tax=Streptomyces sp. CJ_13 TaxID=2724943 RepID=UPI001BDBC1E1|nr:LuxR C-terminal-related transcriptional regulator [Streptomyces sp. CJ_13]MBT1189537.1 DNA-binding protein [Streptomyces sp. CJ_13]
MTTTTAPITPITPAQKRIAEQLVQGLTNSEIASEEHLSRGTVSSHVRGMRQNLHCPRRSSRPVLAHALLIHRQVAVPSLSPLQPSFTADEGQKRLLKAIAEHSSPADNARAAKIPLADVKPLTEDLVRAAGATDSTQLVGWGHALGLLGEGGQDTTDLPAASEGAAR